MPHDTGPITTPPPSTTSSFILGLMDQSRSRHCGHITWKGQGVFCNMQMAFGPPWVTRCLQMQFPESWCSQPPTPQPPARWSSPPARWNASRTKNFSHTKCCRLQLGFSKALLSFLTPSSPRGFWLSSSSVRHGLLVMMVVRVSQQADVISQLPSLQGEEGEASAVSDGSRDQPTLGQRALTSLAQPRDPC